MNQVTWTPRPPWAEHCTCRGSDTAAYEFSVFVDPRQLAKIVSIKRKNWWQSLFCHWCNNVSVKKKNKKNSKSHFSWTKTWESYFAKPQASRFMQQILNAKNFSLFFFFLLPFRPFKQASIAMSGWHLLFLSGSVSPSKTSHSFNPILHSKPPWCSYLYFKRKMAITHLARSQPTNTCHF